MFFNNKGTIMMQVYKMRQVIENCFHSLTYSLIYTLQTYEFPGTVWFCIVFNPLFCKNSVENISLNFMTISHLFHTFLAFPLLLLKYLFGNFPKNFLRKSKFSLPVCNSGNMDCASHICLLHAV